MGTLSENRQKMEDNTRLINSNTEIINNPDTPPAKIWKLTSENLDLYSENMKLAAENEKVYRKWRIFGMCVILACVLVQIITKIIL